MPSEWIDMIMQGIMGIAVAMARIFPLFIIVPVFSGMQLKGMLRNSCALALGLLMLPHNLLLMEQISGINTSLLIIKEAILGFMIGLLLALPFWVIDWAGILIDNQRGALNGSFFNPNLGSDSLLGGMLKQTVILLMIITSGIPLLLEMLWQSYLIWPATQWLPVISDQGVTVWLTQLQPLFVGMILYAAPVVICLLLVDFAMAILGLFSPHLQVSVIAMPIKSLLGLFILVIYLPTLWQQIDQQLQALHNLPQILSTLLTWQQ